MLSEDFKHMMSPSSLFYVSSTLFSYYLFFFFFLSVFLRDVFINNTLH